MDSRAPKEAERRTDVSSIRHRRVLRGGVMEVPNQLRDRLIDASQLADPSVVLLVDRDIEVFSELAKPGEPRLVSIGSVDGDRREAPIVPDVIATRPTCELRLEHQVADCGLPVAGLWRVGLPDPFRRLRMVDLDAHRRNDCFAHDAWVIVGCMDLLAPLRP